MTQRSGPSDKEVRPLTGLRGVAATVVMLYHFFRSDGDRANTLMIDRGYLAVDLFFVLSGFVMALSYGHLFAGRVSLASYRSFLMKRIARVYPLLFVVTAFALAKFLGGHAPAAYAGYGAGDFLANLLMIQAWGFGFISTPSATWSISTEFFAYLAFPLLILVSMNARDLFPALMAAASILGIWLCALSPHGALGPLDITSRDNAFPLIRCLSGFCLGLVAYRLSQRDVTRRWLGSGRASAIVLACFARAVLLRAHDLAIFFLYPFLVVTLSYNNRVADRLFGNRFVHHIGVISYSVYLIHPQVALTCKKLEQILAVHLGTGGEFLALTIYSVAVYAASLACFRLIENPGRKLIRGLASANQPAAMLREVR